jgi:hypothetical protein
MLFFGPSENEVCRKGRRFGCIGDWFLVLLLTLVGLQCEFLLAKMVVD